MKNPKSGRVSRPNGDPLPFFALCAVHRRDGPIRVGNSKICAKSMTTQLQAAGSPSGEENPEVQCLSLFNRPDDKCEQESGGPSMEKRSHGIARAIESM
jgi:hypothetical protein